jgi:DNA polymerase elongation subunit (family B)
MEGDLEFQAVSWLASDVDCEDDRDDDDGEEENYQGLIPKQSIIRVFGRTAAGRSVSLTVTGFRPFLYIKLLDRTAAGKPDAASRLKRRIHERVPRARKETFTVTRHSSKDFWGFQNNLQHNFFKIECSSQMLARQVAFEVRQWRGRDGALDEAALYESNIEPVIRFCHVRDLRPAGWITVQKGKFSATGVSDGEGACELNFEAACKNVFPSHREDIAPLLVASFDLECTSSTGDFPMAIKSCKKLASEMYAEFLKVANSHKSAQLACVRRCLETSLLGKEAVSDPVAGVSPVELKRGQMGADEARNRINKYVEDLRNILAKTMRSHVIKPKDAPREFDALRAVVTRKSAVRMVGLQGDDQKRSKDEVLTDLDLKLSEILPQLKGDSIIQIGTTFHRYGEQAVSRRHVLTLGGCLDIEGTEVVTCDTEVELMMKWSELIRTSDPDILTGYNILGFDFAYLRDRAQELNIEPQFSRLGRLKGQACAFREANLSSSALGDNLLRYYDVEGRVVIDVMKVVQRDHKLDTFKLDHVAETFLGERKHDVSPGDIFRMQEGSDDDRRTIAAYCVQDCALCNRLMIKLEILANNMGMANVCLVPLSYIFMRGQGVKIFSLIAKQCSVDGFLVPTRTPEPDFHGVKDTYEGAIVLDPEAGMYLDEVVCVMDYNSLYPSSIIAENLSHDTIVLDEEAYGRLENVTYGIVSYDVYSSAGGIEGGEAKTKVGERRCKYVKEIDGVKHQGVIPRILEQLLRARKETRNRIAHKRVRILATGEEVCGDVRKMQQDEYEVLGDAYDDFQKAVLDGLQLAYKVTANSLYGQMGARTSPVYLKDIAACTTAVGRNMIILAKSFMEDHYAARVIYGDTVGRTKHRLCHCTAVVSSPKTLTSAMDPYSFSSRRIPSSASSSWRTSRGSSWVDERHW